MIIDFKKLFHTTVVFLVCYFKLLFLFVFSFVGCEQSYIKADKNVDPNNSIYVQDNGLETTITDKDVSADFLKVRYASNEESAAFECYYVFYKDENELSKLSSDNDRFSICSSNGIEVPRQSGKNLLFKVRAILAGGLKDITPARITIPSSQSDNGGDDGDEDTPELLDLSPFSVNITNKTSIVDISAGDSKVFYLQVTKNNQTSPETAQFQIYCKTKESADFVLCEERDRYTFKNLKADTNYSLWIEAVHVSSGRQLLVRDVVNFVAKNSTVTPPPPPPTTPPVEPPTPGIPPTPPPVGGGEELVVPRTPQAVDSINLATVSVQIPAHLVLSQWTRSDSGLNQYQQLRKGQLSKYVGSYPEERQGCSKYATAIKFFQFPGDQRYFYCMGTLPSLGDSNPFAALFGSDLAANSIHLIAPDSSATEMRIAEYSSAFYQTRISQEVCTGNSLDVTATLGDALDAYGYYPNEYKACAREGRDSVLVSIALSFGQTEIVYTEQKVLRRGTWDKFEVLGQMIALVRDTVR